MERGDRFQTDFFYCAPTASRSMAVRMKARRRSNHAPARRISRSRARRRRARTSSRWASRSSSRRASRRDAETRRRAREARRGAESHHRRANHGKTVSHRAVSHRAGAKTARGARRRWRRWAEPRRRFRCRRPRGSRAARQGTRRRAAFGAAPPAASTIRPRAPTALPWARCGRGRWTRQPASRRASLGAEVRHGADGLLLSEGAVLGGAARRVLCRVLRAPRGQK